MERSFLLTYLFEVALFFGGVAIGVYQWFLGRWMEDQKRELQVIHQNHKELDKEVRVVKETYVQKADLGEIKKELIERLARIEEYLINKDKPNV